ncbi:hypothetical protein [Rhizobium arsenicireducens]
MRSCRAQAFKALVGDGIQACPLNEKLPLLKDIYVQSEPEDVNQLYFWLDGAFVKGREKGGGGATVKQAQAFIRDAFDIGFSEYLNKDVDIATIASVYNTPYGPQHYLTDLPGHRAEPGLVGIISEGEAVIDAISERTRTLRTSFALDASCDDPAFERLLDSEAGLKLSAYPLDDANQLARLKVSYALGFIQQHRETAGGTATRTEAYRRYREIWERLKLLSVVRIEGQLLDEVRLGGTCDRCGMAPVTIRVLNGSEMPGCKVSSADPQGRFTYRHTFHRSLDRSCCNRRGHYIQTCHDRCAASRPCRRAAAFRPPVQRQPVHAVRGRRGSDGCTQCPAWIA